MYLFIFWTCLLTAPECPMWHAIQQHVMVMLFKDLEECEAFWTATQRIPDDEGTTSRHKCQPVSEEL